MLKKVALSSDVTGVSDVSDVTGVTGLGGASLSGFPLAKGCAGHGIKRCGFHG